VRVASGVLAHGGSAGAVVEVAFVLVPIAVFALLSKVSKRRRERDQSEPRLAETDSGDTVA